jgi:hypothetical protein
MCQVVRLSLDQTGAARDQLAACRLLLEYAVGKPGAVEGEQTGSGPRFVFQFAGPVAVGVEGGELRPAAAVGLIGQDDGASS